MILRRRDAAHGARAAALDVFSAARFLAAAGVAPARLWVERTDDDPDPRRKPAVDAWSLGIAVVPTSTREARDAAVATATSIGATLVDARSVAGPGSPGGFDGVRLAARHALGLYPDEIVEVVLGAPAVDDLDARLVDFDERAAADPSVRRRLILANVPDTRAQLSPAMISAIVHPLVMIDLRRPDKRTLSLARAAADEVIGPA
jgi:hypothetical protein